ncbi:MAG: DUF87 domain-containing protein [Thermoplasmata archaeon]
MQTRDRIVGPIALRGDSSTLRCFLTSLGRALEAAATGEGVLIEQVLGNPTLELYATDEALIRSVVDTPGANPSVTQVPIRSTLPRRGSGGRSTFGFLVPSPEIADPAARSRVTRTVGERDPNRRTGLLSLKAPQIVGGLCAIQTFWISRPSTIWVARRWEIACSSDSPTSLMLARSVELALASEWADRIGRPVRSQQLRLRGRAERDWNRGRLGNVEWRVGIDLPASRIAATAIYGAGENWNIRQAIHEHLVIFGSSGSGKTSLLARLGCEAAANGHSVVVIDVHGDLALAVANALPLRLRNQLVAVDVTAAQVAGISILGPDDSAHSYRIGAHLVSALKRLTPDGSDVYWGFRLERIFDSFVRLVIDEGGDLRDLIGLLLDPRRREAAQLATSRPELARFLAELPALERRNPEFLWSAAARIAKLSMSPTLLALLAPVRGALPLESLLRVGSVIVFRIPFGTIGAEASMLVATLLLSRIYLSRADPRNLGAVVRPLLLVIDEAQSIAPRLLSEILSEGRKFGVAAHIATQYPDRLAPEVRAAAAGATRSHLLLNLAPLAAASAGAWVGLTPPVAAALLPQLPPGRGILDRGTVATDFQEVQLPDPPDLNPAAWDASIHRTGIQWEVPAIDHDAPSSSDGRMETVLQAILASEQDEGSVDVNRIARYVGACSSEPTEPSQVLLLLHAGARRGLVRPDAKGWQLTPAGERVLGIGIRTGAARESAEHRTLLNLAVRMVARQGLSLEILAQGRFDTTLPDGRIRLLDSRAAGATPGDLARQVHRMEGSWAWRFFGGRDVHVEAEVSGALRPDRIRHGLRKARLHHAFALFLVSDDHRGNRVRAVLREHGAFPRDAQVWVLRAAGGLASASNGPGRR